LFLDGDINGFHAAYVQLDGFVGVTVQVPKYAGPGAQPKLEALGHLVYNLEIILALSIGCLAEPEKRKVVLCFSPLAGYFGIGVKLELTPFLTDVFNKRSGKKKIRADYIGSHSDANTYLFELPYKEEALMTEADRCGTFVKVDLGHPDMQNREVRTFLSRLGRDLSICRGKRYLYDGIEEVLNDTTAQQVLYLMFRNTVPREGWWKDLRNVTNICAAITASLGILPKAMFLTFICSRPGTRGAVEEMLQRISKDARDTYHLDSLVLIPANGALEKLYQKPEYGFINQTEHGLLEKPLA